MGEIKKKKKKEAATQRRDEDGDDVEAVVTLQVCGGGELPVSHRGVKEDTKVGGGRGEAEEPEVCAPEPGDGGGYDRVSSPGPRAAAAAAGLLANTGDGRSEWVSLCWLFVSLSVHNDFPAAAIGWWWDSAR